MLQVDPLDSLIDFSIFHFLNSWRKVSNKDSINIVQNFKESLSQDINGIYSHFLKSGVDLIVPPLAFLVNLCLGSGIHPDSLKDLLRLTPYTKKQSLTLV